MKETAKQHYEKQLEMLHNLLWKMECFHVNQLNRSNDQIINWGDCGSLGHVIDELQSIINFIDRKED